ncbi:MAG: tRNA (adenosine(37)-N6)-dimethylallyltransferase MiaA [Aeriscardovia sp.]|nr:tRNA (adenosine(37)-N6)-dimethylallyltransferase MiaA [Aeriscardovia sp.]
MTAFARRPVSIVGPTAIGKSELAISLALALEPEDSCEIVSQDAYQIYRGMDIGTAKPSPSQLSSVPHHMIDVKDSWEESSAASFQAEVSEVLEGCSRRGVRPILVGGSGLYARGVVDDLSFAPFDPDLRQRLEGRLKKEGARVLWEELERADPGAAASIDPRNGRRVIRAMEGALGSRPYRSSLPPYRYRFPCLQIGLDLPRERLDLRIKERVEKMREEGLEEEVRALEGRMSKTAAQAIGYAQILAFLHGEAGEEEAFSQIEIKTRRLARRQMSWFGRDPRVHWLSASDPDLLAKAKSLVRMGDAGEFDEADLGPKEPTRRPLGSVEIL